MGKKNKSLLSSEPAEEEWDWSLKETIEYMIMKMHVKPFTILRVMHYMKENHMEITAKKLHAVVVAHIKMEKEKGEEEEEQEHSVQEIMHKLYSMHLMAKEAEEKDHEEAESPVAMVLKAMMKMHQKRKRWKIMRR